MFTFNPEIEIIGINPFVFVPEEILRNIFKQAGKDKGTIPICGTINGNPYKQTLLRYKEEWRLYINTSMLKDSPKRIGEKIEMRIEFDPSDRRIALHPKLKQGLEENQEAKYIFDQLRPSLQFEIVRYISFLKTEESIDRNVKRAIQFLLGKERFIGRDKP